MAAALGEMLEAIEEVAPELEEEAGEVLSKETFLEEVSSEMEKTVDEIQIEEKQAFEEGFNTAKDELSSLKNPEEVEKVTSKWTVKNIWENAKSFGKFVGIEAGKGAAFVGGMKIVEKVFEVASKKEGADPDTKKALDISTKLQKASSTIQKVASGWQLWLANHYDDRDTYGSVTVEDTDISRFQILQNKVSDMTKVQDEKVGPAISLAAKQKSLQSLKTLAAAYKTLIEKAYLVSTDIATKEKKMVDAGLTDFKTDLDSAKADIDAAST